MPNVYEEVVSGPRKELIVDLVDRIDRQFAELAVSQVLGKLPKNHHKASWFENCRANRAQESTTEEGGKR